MARAVKTQRRIITTIAAWTIGLIIFFPIFWTILTSFKTEAQAINDPPLFFTFDWTLENYAIVQERSDYMKFLWNSVIIAGGSTVLGILVAIPAAWSMAFVPSKWTKDILLWMLSTKMLPAVGVLYPISLLFVEFNLLDTRSGLMVVLMLSISQLLFGCFSPISKKSLMKFSKRPGWMVPNSKKKYFMF